MTTYNKFREYIWLVNTIYRAKAITFAEINKRWLTTDMSEGIEMARTTFYRHKLAIEEIFGIHIKCDKNHKYYIGNEYVLRDDSVQNWMLSTLSVSNMIGESSSLYHRILLENIPSGDEQLHRVIAAMKENRMVNIKYRPYTSSSTLFFLAPFCVKLFQRRWYLIGRYEDSDNLGVFSFDRIDKVEITDKKFKMPDDFDAADYFYDSYGIVVNPHVKTARVVLPFPSPQGEGLGVGSVISCQPLSCVQPPTSQWLICYLLFFLREKVTDPTPAPPLEGRGKATGRRPQVGNAATAGEGFLGQLLYHCLNYLATKGAQGRELCKI
ncbi:MAG: WYL domain-containing protein [Prevotella sp.]|nr:WYL domain-containing protein [Prevotella sp.]